MHKLGSRIDKQQPAGFDNRITFRSGTVVYDGSMCCIPCNGSETFAHILFLLRSKFPQLFRNGHFRYRTCWNGFFQPHIKSGQCYSVFHHCSAKAVQLGFVLHAFHQVDWRREINDLASCGKMLIKGIVYFAFRYANRCFFGKFFDIIEYMIIICRFYALRLQFRSNGGR